ncbi:MAG: hypothetical protein JJE25_00600, partial [Bacteroidia bacterium]|nr:hypothetical protein [Bacteroidia bacterium]
MKKICLFVFTILVPINYTSAQQWVKLMQDKKTNFYSVQKEFYYYWKSKQAEELNQNQKSLLGEEENDEQAGYNVFKRWEYFTQPRVYPKGERLPSDKAWTEFQKYKQSIHQDNNSTVRSAANWVPLGPFSWQTNSYNPGLGRVNVVAVDPTDSLRIYIGSPSGGFWKSTDGGQHYTCTTDNLAVVGVSSIAIDPNNPSIIFIGTGDSDAGDNYSIGILKSTDYGNTWTPTGMGYQAIQGKIIRKLMFFPGSSSVLFAATSDGIFKSVDAGITWMMKASIYVRDMEFKPGNSAVIYAAGNSFYKSVNSGETFINAGAGLPSANNVQRYGIAVAPTNPNLVYLVAGDANNSSFYGLYASVNSGMSFTARSTSTPNLFGWAPDGSDGGGQCWYSTTIAVSPNDANTIYVGGVNIWQSNDGGVTWHIITHWVYDPFGIYPYVHADQHFMSFFGNTMYVGCDGGIFKSTDFGNTWTDLSKGLQITQFYRLGGTAQNANLMAAGAQDNGCIKMVNNVWTHIQGADGFECVIDPVNSQIIYTESQGGGMNKSTDGGLTYNGIAPPNNGGGAWDTPYMLDPNNHQTIYAGYVNLWKSTNAGATWDSVSAFNYYGNISAFNIAPSNSNVIYVNKNDTLWVTTNGGTTWNNISAGLPLPWAWLTYITISNTDPNRVWVTFSGYNNGVKVYGSYDGGASWFNYSGNLPNLPVNCILYQNNSYEGLYIGTDVGIFYRDSTLANWQPFYDGLPNVIVAELEINYPTGKIRAATYGRGMWESGLYVPLSAPPVAAFTADRVSICPSETVLFTDHSTNSMAQWHLSFPGGLPSVSSQQNPSVVYYTPGVYPVSLVAYNVWGTDTAVQTSYITVAFPPTQPWPLTEGFELSGFPPANWKIINTDYSITWEQVGGVGAYGNSLSCTRIDNYDYYSPGTFDVLLTSPYDLTITQQPILHFDHAYALYPGYADTLRVFYTTDCGITKHTLWMKGNSTLETSPPTTNRFVPNSGEWQTDTIHLNALTIYNDI